MSEHSLFVDAKGDPIDLVLYKFDACPFCRRVQNRARELGYRLATRDTRRDPEARDDLVSIGGRGQVPCLVINGKPLYESLDIIQFLENEVRPAALEP